MLSLKGERVERLRAAIRSIGIGGPEGSRTPDLQTASLTRSQLRHGPTTTVGSDDNPRFRPDFFRRARQLSSQAREALRAHRGHNPPNTSWGLVTTKPAPFA